jgi:nicotinamide mononucleotide adenylyltransferase
MSKVYDVALVVMRAQTFHKGHEHLIDMALALSDRVLILVGSAQECGTKRNPLNIETRINSIKAVYDDENIVMVKALSDMTNEDDINTDWGKYVLENCKRYIHKAPSIILYGKEEGRDGYSWFADEDMKKTTQVIVNRSDIPVCATYLRDLMCMDNREEWMEWVDDKLHKYYDELRNELLSVPYYKQRSIDLLTGKEHIGSPTSSNINKPN